MCLSGHLLYSHRTGGEFSRWCVSVSVSSLDVLHVVPTQLSKFTWLYRPRIVVIIEGRWTWGRHLSNMILYVLSLSLFFFLQYINVLPQEYTTSIRVNKKKRENC